MITILENLSVYDNKKKYKTLIQSSKATVNKLNLFVPSILLRSNFDLENIYTIIELETKDFIDISIIPAFKMSAFSMIQTVTNDIRRLSNDRFINGNRSLNEIEELPMTLGNIMSMTYRIPLHRKRTNHMFKYLVEEVMEEFVKSFQKREMDYLLSETNEFLDKTPKANSLFVEKSMKNLAEARISSNRRLTITVKRLVDALFESENSEEFNKYMNEFLITK